ncbi:MAG: hypothetical protein M1822_003592 [Bathelium mastoideum]|nr:MAG: hypothetical protein M1822_003592 [Bathelium mastoideum]
MDIDMDIDMDVDLEINPFEAPEPPQTNGTSQTAISSDPTIADAAPEKVHLRGLDELTTNDIRDYIFEYYPSDDFVRVEWIDDTSANIVYKTSESAFTALTSLSDVPESDLQTIHTLQLRRAKPITARPNSELQIRQAIVTDIKKPRAREASRFYLLHPDQDPGERNNRRGRGGRATGDRGDYKRRRFDDRENARRKEGDAFDASMYDDDGGDALDKVDNRHGRRRRVRFGAGQDLLPGSGLDGRLRGRSASPVRGGDGTLGFDDDNDDGSTSRRPIRQRSDTPPSARRQRRPGTQRQSSNNNKNAGIELLGSDARTGALRSSNPGAGVRELLPDRATASPRRSRDLFPHRTDKSNHRRSDALDAEEQADLSSRITGTPTSFGRLRSDDIAFASTSTSSSSSAVGGGGVVLRGDQGFSIRGQDPGISIRGSAAAVAENGFAIRGAAQDPLQPGGKELFPMKAGNAGKELLGEKIKGRGGPRRKAEDMYF